MTRNALLTCGIAAFVTGPALQARAEQTLLLDTGEYSHLADNSERNRPIKNDPANRGSHAYFRAAPTTPRNWITPINYRDGKIYVIVDVVSKPSAAVTRLSFCMENPGAHCVGQVAFTKVGRVLINGQKPGTFYSAGADYTRLYAWAPIVLRDGSTSPGEGYKLDPGQRYIGAPDASLYFPLKMRVRAYAVSQGAAFQPPDDVVLPGADAGADASGSGPLDSAGPTASDGAADLATVSPPDAGSTPEGPPPTARDSGPRSVPEEPAPTGPPSSGERRSTAEASGCSAGRTTSAWSGIALVLIALALLRPASSGPGPHVAVDDG